MDNFESNWYARYQPESSFSSKVIAHVHTHTHTHTHTDRSVPGPLKWLMIVICLDVLCVDHIVHNIKFWMTHRSSGGNSFTPDPTLHGTLRYGAMRALPHVMVTASGVKETIHCICFSFIASGWLSVWSGCSRHVITAWTMKLAKDIYRVAPKIGTKCLYAL